MMKYKLNFSSIHSGSVSITPTFSVCETFYMGMVLMTCFHFGMFSRYIFQHKDQYRLRTFQAHQHMNAIYSKTVN